MSTEYFETNTKNLVIVCEEELETGRLDPVEALYGRRTSPANQFAEFDNNSNKSIRYVDFTSL